jgi:hypothetical protein
MELKLANRIRLILSASPELWYDGDKENLYVIDNNTVYKYADIPVSAWYIIKGGDLGFFDQITEVMPYRVVPNIPKTKQLDYFKLPAPSVVMWKVDSSNIKYVGYDSEQMKLYVMFNDDSVYEYSGVEPEIWNGIKNADSKGSYLHWFAKVNQYPYQRIGGFLLDYSDNYLSPNTGTPHPDGYLTGF